MGAKHPAGEHQIKQQGEILEFCGFHRLMDTEKDTGTEGGAQEHVPPRPPGAVSSFTGSSQSWEEVISVLRTLKGELTSLRIKDSHQLTHGPTASALELSMYVCPSWLHLA